MKDYKFKSEITLKVLPYGTTLLSEVSRDEVPDIMKEIVERAGAVNWVKMAAKSVTEDSSWDEEAVKKRTIFVMEDLRNLKSKLNVSGAVK